jgi:hypothetical protein
MTWSTPTLRWIALTLLWGVVGLVLWLMAVQGFLALIAVPATWQRPAVAKVSIERIERDDSSALTHRVFGERNKQLTVLNMLKSECEQLHPGDEIWILDNYCAGPVRPEHFRLTPLRLLLEYPEPLLIPVLWLIWRLRKAQVREAKAPLRSGLPVITDDFHTRALRFSSKKPGEE